MPSSQRLRMQFRLPGALLVALLITILTISGLTFLAIKGQRYELEAAREDSIQQALKLLANRIELSLDDSIQTPFRLLARFHLSDLDDTHFRQVLDQNTDVNQILVLDYRLELVSTYPQSGDQHDISSNRWIVERLQEGDIRRDTMASTPLTFMETVRGQAFLYAIEHVRAAESVQSFIGRAMHPDNWIILRFNLTTLRQKGIVPLLENFMEQHGGDANLVGPEVDVDEASMTEPLSRMLPGWQVVYRVPMDAGSQVFGSESVLLVAAAGGALLAIMLSGLGIWSEIRREHADIELRNRFVANVSHELKTPLSLIRMYAETLCLGRLNDSNRQREYFQVILREAERLTKLIENVLDFSRLRGGDEIYRLTETDLAATVRRILDQYTPRFEAMGFSVESHIGELLPPVAHDPNGITQILLNLLDNAVKYAASGQRVLVRLTSDANWVDLQVSDFGPGLSASEHAQVLHSLRKGQLKKEIRGSGIGLTMVDLIAKRHHAHFILDTPEGHMGLRATISFPRYRQV